MTGSAKKEPAFYGHVKGEYIALLQPFVEHQRSLGLENRFWHGCMFIEPAEIGGCYIGAATAHALAVLHDPDGYASKAMTLDIPDAMFAACIPKKSFEMIGQGWPYSFDVPEWMQPGTAVFLESGAWLNPKMPHPSVANDNDCQPQLYSITADDKRRWQGLSYSLKAGVSVDWRKPLANSARPESPCTITACPKVVGLFGRIWTHMAEAAQACNMVHQTYGPTEGVIVSIVGRTDFIGAYMPQRLDPNHKAPQHFLAAPALAEVTQ